MYAVYKAFLGWAFYNDSPNRSDADGRENQEKRVAAFKLVVKLADHDKAEESETKTTNNLDLREEALKDLIMVWADAEERRLGLALFQIDRRAGLVLQDARAPRQHLRRPGEESAGDRRLPAVAEGRALNGRKTTRTMQREAARALRPAPTNIPAGDPSS